MKTEKRFELLPGEVDIWVVCSVDNPAATVENTLSQNELATADCFISPEHRRAYVSAHTVLRNILSRYLACNPAEITFARDAFGKPFLERDGAGIKLMFSLSHSNSLVVVALTSGRRIGVDAEYIRPIDDWNSIAHAHFTSGESALIRNEAPQNRVRAFYQCWTRKEAYVKAIGKGLSLPLTSFDTSNLFGQTTAMLASSGDAPITEKWSVADIDVPAGYAGAVVVEERFDRLSYREWTSSDDIKH